MSELSVDISEIDSCITNNLKNEETSSLSKDTVRYDQNRVFNYPSLYINNIKYKVIKILNT